LHLDETKIGDEGLKEISTIPKLDRLSMGGTQVTDKGLQALDRHEHA
jgi:hypothetical protein